MYTLVCFDLAVGVVVVVFLVELAKAQVGGMLSRAWVFVSQFLGCSAKSRQVEQDQGHILIFRGISQDPGCQATLLSPFLAVFLDEHVVYTSVSTEKGTPDFQVSVLLYKRQMSARVLMAE